MTDWPRDEHGRRTDPVGRFLENLSEAEKQAWGSTCSMDTPKLKWRVRLEHEDEEPE